MSLRRKCSNMLGKSMKKIFFISLVVYLTIIVYIASKLDASFESQPSFVSVIEKVEIGPPIDPKKPHPVTIITALFKLNTNQTDFATSNFIRSVREAPFIAFVDKPSSTHFIKLCRHYNSTATVFILPNIWKLMQELETIRKCRYMFDYLLVDKTKRIEQTALENLRVFLARKIAIDNPYYSKYFFYVDIESFQARLFRQWPDKVFLGEVMNRIGDRVLFGQHVNWNDYKQFNSSYNYIQGEFFVGTKLNIERLFHAYYSEHDKSIGKNHVPSRDLVIRNQIVYEKMKKKDHLAVIRNYDVKCTVNKIYFHLYYFAKKSDYICSGDKISLLELF